MSGSEEWLAMVYSPKHHGEVGTRLAGSTGEERERGRRRNSEEMRGRGGRGSSFLWIQIAFCHGSRIRCKTGH